MYTVYISDSCTTSLHCSMAVKKYNLHDKVITGKPSYTKALEQGCQTGLPNGCKSYGLRALSVIASWLWNKLPMAVTCTAVDRLTIINIFKSKLKTLNNLTILLFSRK